LLILRSETGRENEERKQQEAVVRKHCLQPAKDICRRFLEYALRNDDYLRQIGEQRLRPR
jgi:hypothetical protein